MRGRILSFTTTVFFSMVLAACGSFGGVATDPGKTTTTNLNMPADKIVPYNDPNLDKSRLPKEEDLCQGVPSRNGFKCKPSTY